VEYFDDGEDVDAATANGEGYGASLWNRVASAANTLTVNVGKAWAAGLFTEDGPVTPDGGESRLTQALKSYHLSKARTASDLPSWLFTEDERRVTRSGFTARDRGEEMHREGETRPPRRRGLKDVYADEEGGTSTNNGNAAPTSGYLRERTRPARSWAQVDEPEERYNPPATQNQSKATSRLQAMRDARRPNGREQRSPVQHTVDQDSDYYGSPAMHEPPAEVPLRRVGLPSGPKRRYA